MFAIIIPLHEGAQLPITGAPGVPTHPIVLPPEGPPSVWPPAHPSHPWQPPTGTQPPVPPGFWGGSGVPTPTPPIYIPVEPSPPIEGAAPGQPIYIPVYPAHPIQRPEDIAEAIKAAIKGAFEPGGKPPTSGMPAPKPAK